MSSIRDGVRAAVPLAPGPVLFGLAFGVLAVESGLSPVAAVAFSSTTFAGSAQFAATTVLGDGGTALAAVGAGILLNARYLPMSVAIAAVFTGGRLRRLVGAQLMVDESWALAGRSGRFDRGVLVGAGLLLYACWVGSTALGTVIGDWLNETVAFALEAAFATLFLGLAVPYLKTRQAQVAATIGAVIVLVLLPVAPAGIPIAAASVACVIGLRR